MTPMQQTLFDADARTWPHGWDGNEPLASAPFQNVNRDGSVEYVFEELLGES